MERPAAKGGDRITATDTHIVRVGNSVAALPHPFVGTLGGSSLSGNVNIMGMPAAMVGSTADNMPHLPTKPGTSFQRPPTNKGTITQGSSTVFINGKPAARDGDPALTCNDPADQPIGKVVATGTVMIG